MLICVCVQSMYSTLPSAPAQAKRSEGLRNKGRSSEGRARCPWIQILAQRGAVCLQASCLMSLATFFFWNGDDWSCSLGCYEDEINVCEVLSFCSVKTDGRQRHWHHLLRNAGHPTRPHPSLMTSGAHRSSEMCFDKITTGSPQSADLSFSGRSVDASTD